MTTDSESRLAKATKQVIGLLTAGAIFGGVLVGITHIIHWIQDQVPQSVEVTIPKVPPVDPSPNGTGAVIERDTTIIPILEKDYVPSDQPFADVHYKEAPRILYKGSFADAFVRAEGEVVGEGERMLLFNFGQETGLIKGARRSANLIDLQRTRKLGGIFTAGNAIFAEINLLEDRLGSSSDSFGKCDNGICTFHFIKNSSQPEVAPVLVVPLTVAGQFGGASIKSLSVHYRCAEGKTCEIVKCTEDTAYQCILRKYGKREADKWAERYFGSQQL